MRAVGFRSMISLACVSAIGVVLSGCTSLPRQPGSDAFKIYNGPDQPAAGVATLVTQSPIVMFDHDQWSSPKGNIFGQLGLGAVLANRTEFAILPGTLKAAVVYYNYDVFGSRLLSQDPVLVPPAEIIAGHKYAIFYTIVPEGGAASIDDTNYLFLEPFMGEWEMAKEGHFKGSMVADSKLNIRPFVAEITGHSELDKISEHPDWLVRRQYATLFDSTNILSRIASSDPDRMVRIAAADRLSELEGRPLPKPPRVFDDYDMTKSGMTAADVVTLAVKYRWSSTLNPFSLGLTAKNNGDLRFETVDGLWHRTWWRAPVLKLLPGKHTMRVQFWLTPGQGIGNPGAAADLAFNLAAGHSYTLRYDHTRSPLMSGMVLSWQNELKLTITDDVTGEVVCQF